jgi:hypothetical protein
MAPWPVVIDSPPCVAVYDDICTFACEVFTADTLFPALAALALLVVAVVFFDFAFHEGFHLLLTFAGLCFLQAG